MGLSFHDGRLYFGGKTFLGIADTSQGDFNVMRIVDFHDRYWGGLKKRFGFRIGAYERHLKYREPQFHQMTFHEDTLYVSATECKEVWEIDTDLRLRRRVILQPRYPNYNHINNVFFDGDHFYVCLMRYARGFGYGGYAKFDRDWNELERRQLGWEAHAFSVIDGHMLNLCASAGALTSVHHPHRAGLMLDGDFVFEHDPDEYYCKDFSMDDNNIYIVGGEVKPRHLRKTANGVVFVLDRQFNLVREHVIPDIGGVCGCRLPDIDYTDSARTWNSPTAVPEQHEQVRAAN